MKKLRSALRITDVDTVSDAVVRIYKAADSLSQDAYLAATFAEIETLSGDITAAIRRDKTVSTMDEADATRDEIVRQLSAVLTGYANLPVPAKQTAGSALLATFNKYGKSMTDENYARESSLISSLLTDFASTEAKEAAASLEGVSELISALSEAQDAFNKANDEYNAATAVKAESATSLKKRLIVSINDKLVPYLAAMLLANPAAYSDFCAKVENAIVRANAAPQRAKGTAESSLEAGE